jgi:hypothetical protein
MNMITADRVLICFMEFNFIASFTPLMEKSKGNLGPKLECSVEGMYQIIFCLNIFQYMFISSKFCLNCPLIYKINLEWLQHFFTES